MHSQSVLRSIITARFHSLSLILLLPVCFAVAETGMCIVSNGNANWASGPMYRIDIVNDTIKTPTNSLGAGSQTRFSPDGKKICFFRNGGNTVVISTIDGAQLRTFPCDPLPQFGKLSWTTDNAIWVGLDGKIVKYDTLGNVLLTYTTAQYEVRGLVSRNEITATATYINGVYKPVIYQMRSHTTLRPSISGDGCSVCPSPNGLMCTNNLRDSPTGNGIHRTMRILDTLGHLVGGYLDVQNITKFTASDYHIDGQCWSGNSNDWIVIPAGQGTDDVSNNCSPCIYNLTTHQKVCFKDNTNTSIFWTPFDYYSGWAPSATTPALQISPISLNFSADSGAANPPAQNITATTSAGSLAGLSVSGAPAWLTVTPQAASGSSILIVNSASIAGLVPNIYRDTITVTTTNAGSRTYPVALTINRPAVARVLTTLSVSPAGYTVAAGSSIVFIPTCKDQAGAYITNPAVTWAASGGGTIDANGRYAAAATPSHGPHRIIAAATSGGVTLRDTAWIMVGRQKTASTHRRIDCGSNALLPAGWETDDAYVNGGLDGANIASVTTAGVPAAAPAEVYRSFRRGNPHSYRVPQLIEGPYAVRMHFVDPKDTARLMSYSIQNVNVLRDFTISTLAGGAAKALVLDFPAIVIDTNGISIACAAASGDVFEAGVEMMQEDLRQMTLISPQGGQKYSVGQVLPIVFRNDTLTVRQMYVELSVENGKNFNNFTGSYGIKMEDFGASWGTYNWTIPDSIDVTGGRISTISTLCKIRIRPYTVSVQGFDLSDSAFTISARVGALPTAARSAAADRLTAVRRASVLTICASSAAAFRIDVFGISGKSVVSFCGRGDQSFTVPLTLDAGMLLVRMKTASGVMLAKRIPK